MDLQGSKTGLLTCSEKMFCYSFKKIFLSTIWMHYFKWFYISTLISTISLYELSKFPYILLILCHTGMTLHSYLLKSYPLITKEVEITPPLQILLNLVLNNLSYVWTQTAIVFYRFIWQLFKYCPMTSFLLPWTIFKNLFNILPLLKLYLSN